MYLSLWKAVLWRAASLGCSHFHAGTQRFEDPTRSPNAALRAHSSKMRVAHLAVPQLQCSWS